MTLTGNHDGSTIQPVRLVKDYGQTVIPSLATDNSTELLEKTVTYSDDTWDAGLVRKNCLLNGIRLIERPPLSNWESHCGLDKYTETLGPVYLFSLI